MKLSGKYRIEAPRQKVWDGLNDPDILRSSIPGCEELNQDSPTDFSAVVKAKLGPVSARFKGSVNLEDLDPPNGYTLRGEGKGGLAGFGKGASQVTLEEIDGATILSYDADAQIGGKLAAIGSRLISGSVKKLAGEFFTNFAANIGAEAQEMPAEEN